MNLLSDRAHPTQALADLLTLREVLGRLDGLRLAYVGDGNNVATSLAFAAALSGLELVVSSPPGYELDDDVVERARNLGGTIELVTDPHEAVRDADAVYTDVWTSMGQEDEAEVRREAFAGYQVDRVLMESAGPRARLLHCLPAHRGEEVTARGPRRAAVGRVAAGGEPHARHPRAPRDARRGGVTVATLGKPQRQHRISRVLEEQAVSSQAQLVELLAADGVVATQATVSRDLEELGAVKVRIPGGTMAYAIPEHAKERSAPDDHLRRVMGEFVVDVAHSANLVVLRTPPGSAHVVASALDRAGLPDVLGTVAGDDTLVLVCSEQTGGADVASTLAALAGL